jgi:WhiB family redox-sensing transcriptional regulator
MACCPHQPLFMCSGPHRGQNEGPGQPDVPECVKEGKRMGRMNIDPITRRRLPSYLIGRPGLASWKHQAACLDADSDTFFSVGYRITQQDEEALAICQECPVIRECLEHAIEVPERYGVWGGTTARERGWDSVGRPLKTAARRVTGRNSSSAKSGDPREPRPV